MQSVASILRVRNGGEVIGYTRRMRAIKQNRFHNQPIAAGVSKSISTKRDTKTRRNLHPDTVGPRVIYPDQPSPVAPSFDAIPYYGPLAHRHSLKFKKWRLPKTKSEATALIERERRFFVELPLSLQRVSDRALSEINFRLTGPSLVQQPRLYPSVM
uniref:Uncharacterized protein n=1 Tax=Plectus sambesii TaxID=2011161 RepID=A0A914WQ96_9BILA